jgi:hypothetical protein
MERARMDGWRMGGWRLHCWNVQEVPSGETRRRSAKIDKWLDRSSVLLEADDFSEVAETLAAEEQVVLADEAGAQRAAPALAAVLAEFAGVGPPEQVGHVAKININI